MTFSETEPSSRAADLAEVAQIEIRILDLERALDALRNQKQIVLDRLAAYKYPVLTLPSEIVSKIFLHSLPPYPLCPPATGICSPTNLTHICRKWRAIALATPALWRAIPLRYDGENIGDKQVDMLQSWLSKSGALPLAIEMDERYPHFGVLHAIIRHSARWERAILAVNMLSDLLYIKGPMPLLRSLSIFVYTGIETSAVSLSDLSLLRSVTLKFASLTTNVKLLPWSQLTSLTLITTRPSKCAPILAEGVNLIHCKLVVVAWDEFPDTKLQRLESLVLVLYPRPTSEPRCPESFDRPRTPHAPHPGQSSRWPAHFGTQIVYFKVGM
ncbi:hypothetical protein B0H11DRAFT_2015275 [Mycena galericulata]|nr:hypothetical protein B0H11DRAFT_2015275 [Mycena galericulata]